MLSKKSARAWNFSSRLDWGISHWIARAARFRAARHREYDWRPRSAPGWLEFYTFLMNPASACINATTRVCLGRYENSATLGIPSLSWGTTKKPFGLLTIFSILGRARGRAAARLWQLEPWTTSCMPKIH